MSTFAATVLAADGPDALARVERRLPEGFTATGQVSVRSERHGLWDVAVAHEGGDVDGAWVMLTSYGISPSPDLGSRWERVLGVTAA